MADPDLKAVDRVGNMTVAELESFVTTLIKNELAETKLQQELDPYEAMIQEVKRKMARPYDPTAPSFLDIVQEIASQVPDEEWDKIPKDASKRYKEYLYGSAWNQE